MKINEALKKERKAQHKTQAEWIKDIDMSVSHYSEIESGYTRNGKHSDIDSEDLILLLKSNNVSVNDFFDVVQNSYVVDQKSEKVKQLFKDLSKAFNEKNYAKAKAVRDEVQQLPYAPKYLYYCAILITADLKDNMLSLDPLDKKRINKYIYQSSDWVDNSEILVIFGNSLPILDKNILNNRMKQLLRRYKKINDFPTNVQVRISTICINYLYDNVMVRKDNDYLPDALKLIKDLPANDIFGLKKIIAKYLEDVANENVLHKDDLQTILIRSGLKNVADRLLI